MNKKRLIHFTIVAVVVMICLGGILKSWIPVIPVIVAALIFAYIYFGWNYGGYKFVRFFKLKVVPLLNKRNVILLSGVTLIILLLLSFSKCTGCNNDSDKNVINSAGQIPEVTTEEENTSNKKETTEKEETTSVEETTEEETTTPEETSKKVSPGKTTPINGAPSNKTPEIEVIPETTTLTQEEKESLGIVETPGSVVKEEKITMKVPEVVTSKKEVETTTSKKVEVTTAAPKEEVETEVSVKNPFEEEETEQITKPTTVETIPAANASVTISYTAGASTANVLVTLDRAENVSFIVKWYNKKTDNFKAIKNPDGSYSIKVDVPEGCNSKLIITVFDKAGNELGEGSKMIYNN